MAWRVPAALLALLVLLAASASWVAPYPLAQPTGYDRLLNLAPSLAHPFGTDDLGRDVLTRMLYGAQISLSVALTAALLSLVCGASGSCAHSMLRWQFHAYCFC